MPLKTLNVHNTHKYLMIFNEILINIIEILPNIFTAIIENR